MQSKNIGSYSKIGFPVSSTNSTDMVSFFQSCEKWNIDILPKQLVSHKLGWIGEDRSSFLLGDQFINSSGEITGDSSDKVSEEKVILHLNPQNMALSPKLFTQKVLTQHGLRRYLRSRTSQWQCLFSTLLSFLHCWIL